MPSRRTSPTRSSGRWRGMRAASPRPLPRAREALKAVRGHEALPEPEGSEPRVGNPRERLQVHDVLQVVLEEEVEGGSVPALVRTPEADRVESAEALGGLGPREADPALDPLEAALEPEATQGIEEVHVDLVKPHPRERGPKEGHVEPRPVERHEELRAVEGLGQLLEVRAPDEGHRPAAVVQADDGHSVPARGEPRRLDVQVGDPIPELWEGAPVLPRGQVRRKVPVPSVMEGRLGPLDLPPHGLRESTWQVVREAAAADVLPRAPPCAPEPRLRPLAPPGDVEARLAQHGGRERSAGGSPFRDS